MDNRHRKLFVIKQSKGCKCMPKMHQNTLDAAGCLRSPSDPIVTSKGREGIRDN